MKPTRPVGAPYIATRTVPGSRTFALQLSNPARVRYSSVLALTKPSCSSPDFSQGMSPPKYAASLRDGVPPELVSPTSLILPQAQPAGNSLTEPAPRSTHPKAVGAS